MSEKIRNKPNNETKAIKVDFENYFSNTIIPQLLVDADLILRIFTPPAMKQFSFTKADINQSIHNVKNNIRYPTIVENIEEVLATGEILEKEIQTTDGNWFQMNILPYKLKGENKTNGVIITFVDITKRIVTLKELEKLNAEHNMLMHTLSHDIRQPLSTIVLLTDVLQKAFDTKNEVLFKKFIATLKNTATNMKTIVNDFALESKVDPTEPTSEERLNIEDICEDLILSLRDQIVKNNVEVTTDFQTSEIKFPKNNLRSIVYNLLNNAIKYNQSEKDLKIKISTEKTEDFVLLTIRDNGSGISEIEQKEIFDKPSGLQRNIEGERMGLHILKKMVHDQGGKIEIKSILGEGTTFRVYFKNNYHNS